MVEVFKTNVTHHDHAIVLLEEIHRLFDHYQANFDLDDCDRILRVKCPHGLVNPSELIDLLRNLGVEAEVLPDDTMITPPIGFSRLGAFYLK